MLYSKMLHKIYFHSYFLMKYTAKCLTVLLIRLYHYTVNSITVKQNTV